jgi:uncharacterized membrane protein
MVSNLITDHHSLKIMKIISILILLLLIISIFPLSTAQHPSEDGMPDYAESVANDTHYIFNTLYRQDTLEIEEWIWFTNTGNENFTGNMYVWSQPQDILTRINKFGIIVNGSFLAVHVYPSEFSPNFIYFNLTEYGINIEPQKTLQLVYNYTLGYPSTNKFTYTRIFLYDNSDVIIMINANKNYNVEGVVDDSGKLTLEPVDSKTYITKHDETLSVDQGQSLSFIFTQKESGDEDGSDQESLLENELLWVIIIIVLIAIMILFRYRRSRNLDQELDQEVRAKKRSKPSSVKAAGIAKQKKVKPPRKVKDEKKKKDASGNIEDTRRKVNLEIKKILKITDRLKKDHKNGLISKEMYDKLRDEYKPKLKKLRKEKDRLDKIKEDQATGKAPELNELLKKKKTILNAINKLDEDRESGTISKDLYNDMMPVYKNQAVEILEKIDNLKGRNL